MKRFSIAASVLALGLFAGLPSAYAESGQAPVGTSVAKPSLSAEIKQILADKRALEELSDAELKQRFRLARAASLTEGVPDNVRKQLRTIATGARNEMLRREQAATQKAQPAEEAPPPPKRTERKKPAAEEQQEFPEQQAQEQTRQPVPSDVRAILSDARPLDEIPAEELSARAKRAFTLSRNAEIPRQFRNQLAEISKADRAELVRRAQTKKPRAGTDDVQPEDERVIEVPAEQQKPREIIVDNAPQFDEQAESDARRLLADQRNVEGMDSKQLRARLEAMREILASEGLRPRTARDLRRKLDQERAILRDRLAFEQAEADQAAGAAQPKPRKEIVVGADGDLRVILRDRRRGEDLSDDELRRRIRVLRDVQSEREFAEAEEQDRAYWRRTLELDRDILRRRLLVERERREDELDRSDVDIEIGVNVNPGRPAPRDVFVAEADDEDIEEILVAPPRERVTRRYSVEELAETPSLRRSIPRLEIDTVRFGFNEAFVREEEIESLDRIAAIMERILKKYSREIFLIEGHTDAVGSDIYNLNLSRARADAIKRALSTYYNIPERNLRTIGLGERFLKIPTPEAEAENRRVSISRITNFVSSAE